MTLRVEATMARLSGKLGSPICILISILYYLSCCSSSVSDYGAGEELEASSLCWLLRDGRARPVEVQNSRSRSLKLQVDFDPLLDRSVEGDEETREAKTDKERKRAAPG